MNNDTTEQAIEPDRRRAYQIAPSPMPEEFTYGILPASECDTLDPHEAVRIARDAVFDHLESTWDGTEDVSIDVQIRVGTIDEEDVGRLEDGNAINSFIPDSPDPESEIDRLRDQIADMERRAFMTMDGEFVGPFDSHVWYAPDDRKRPVELPLIQYGMSGVGVRVPRTKTVVVGLYGCFKTEAAAKAAMALAEESGLSLYDAAMKLRAEAAAKGGE